MSTHTVKDEKDTMKYGELYNTTRIKYGINILRNVKYLPISTVDIQWLNLFFFLVGMRVAKYGFLSPNL